MFLIFWQNLSKNTEILWSIPDKAGNNGPWDSYNSKILPWSSETSCPKSTNLRTDGSASWRPTWVTWPWVPWPIKNCTIILRIASRRELPCLRMSWKMVPWQGRSCRRRLRVVLTDSVRNLIVWHEWSIRIISFWWCVWVWPFWKASRNAGSFGYFA